MSSEIRQNKATKEWVIVAPARGKRPHDFQQQREHQHRPGHDPQCPFCPGNEHALPTVIRETRGPGNGAWQTRVVTNKYPALLPESSVERYPVGPYLAMGGYGHHEVIIESPRHDQDIVTLAPAELAVLIETYHARYLELRTDPKNVLIMLFRNHGPRAGASLLHPHSQIITTGIIPRHIRTREYEALRYFDECGGCVYCDMLAFEREDRRRVVFENASFVGFVPFAADVPFETWIMPKQHQADFGQMAGDERADLADALQSILCRLHAKLGDPDYNYTVNSSARGTNSPQLHWYLRVRPRLVTRAGFEIGSGIRINPSLPESDAAFLNETAA